MCIQEPGLRKEWAGFGRGMGTSLVVALFLLLLGHQFGSSNVQALSHKCFNQCQDTAGSLAVLNPGEQFEGPQTPVSQHLINIISHEVNRASLILENRKRKDAEDSFAAITLEASQPDQDHWPKLCPL